MFLFGRKKSSTFTMSIYRDGVIVVHIFGAKRLFFSRSPLPNGKMNKIGNKIRFGWTAGSKAQYWIWISCYPIFCPYFLNPFSSLLPNQ